MTVEQLQSLRSELDELRVLREEVKLLRQAEKETEQLKERLAVYEAVERVRGIAEAKRNRLNGWSMKWSFDDNEPVPYTWRQGGLGLFLLGTIDIFLRDPRPFSIVVERPPTATEAALLTSEESVATPPTS